KRASGATYINKSGVLTVAEVDEPRFEREGLLIEGQRTTAAWRLQIENRPGSSCCCRTPRRICML
ncbi:hypothetical protein, partial [Escherichia coli]|uniref:hypothetical protein n=1 Tax=Escherichia coli TaxID=562 RepID=UPI003D277CEA